MGAFFLTSFYIIYLLPTITAKLKDSVVIPELLISNYFVIQRKDGNPAQQRYDFL